MKSVMRTLVGLGLIGMMSIGQALAADQDMSSSSPEELIAGLAMIGVPAPGVGGAAPASTFVAEAEDPDFQTGVMGAPLLSVPPQMRELVHRGPSVLPVLIQHLDDKRTTNLSVDSDLQMWRRFDDEYDPRTRTAGAACDEACVKKREARVFDGPYTVKVGDVCFVLIGQIVNRDLTAVRHLPTGGLVVNSPAETPALIEQVKADWGQLDAQGHKAALLADIAADGSFRTGQALRRLRFYYPDAYAALDGENAKKRDAFEAEANKPAAQ